MVNSVGTTGGYQSYAYQQQTNPVQQEQRGGENRIERREAPAADSQRGDQRSLASRDEQLAPRSANDDTGARDNRDTGTRGQTLDVIV
ncbi:MAG: hypothetical protein RBS08_07525 [Bdellovibrionales bacterium]|jgi:hypothetical protein|nr:hypothetical protein [Bdellovibrionales bacterium]